MSQNPPTPPRSPPSSPPLAPKPPGDTNDDDLIEITPTPKHLFMKLQGLLNFNQVVIKKKENKLEICVDKKEKFEVGLEPTTNDEVALDLVSYFFRNTKIF